MTQIRLTDSIDGRALYRLLAVIAVILLVEVVAVLAYVRTTGMTDVAAGQYAYPLVWINLTLVAVVVAQRRSPPLSALPAVIAGTYFLLLAWLGGLVSLGGTGSGLAVHTLPPGWGPMIAYDGGIVTVLLVPFRVIGYLGLAYLVYVALGRSLGAGAVGLIGLLSCVTCTGSLLAVLLAGLGGGSVATLDAIGNTTELSLLVFAASLVALVWVIERPAERDVVLG